jgi:hypothetical protein
MTAQISDVVVYRKSDYALARVNGTGLFQPADHGFTPGEISSACWRGFYCAYEVADGSLFLTRVYVGLSEEDEAALNQGGGPRLFGRAPRRYTEQGYRVTLNTGETETSWESDDFIVDGLREPMPFTGGLILAADFIRELYVHMGLPPAVQVPPGPRTHLRRRLPRRSVRSLGANGRNSRPPVVVLRRTDVRVRAGRTRRLATSIVHTRIPPARLIPT